MDQSRDWFSINGTATLDNDQVPEMRFALAIISAKPAHHFRGRPGGYFYRMVAKAKAGALNFGRTV